MSFETSPQPYPESGNSIKGKELDYKKYDMSHASYQLTKVSQITGYGEANLTPAGGDESIFELSPKVYNFAESYLQFTATPVAAAGKCNWMYADGVPWIRQLQLYTKTGLFLADIPDVGNYTNMTLRRGTHLNDMLSQGQYSSANKDLFNGICPSSAMFDTSDSSRYDGSDSRRSYLEAKYCIGGVALNSATPEIYVQLSLSRILNSIFSVDKDIYFGGEIMYLRIVWNSTNKIGWTSTSDTDVADGAAAYNAGIALTNLYLYMAVERNPELENSIKNKVLSPEGFNLLIPTIHMNKINLGGMTHNLSVKYSRGANGPRLLKIYWAPYNNTESANTAYDHDNLDDAKIIAFHTAINGVRTSQFEYYCNGDDYRAQRKKLAGSCILSENEYYYNWVWVEDFTNNYSMLEKPLSPPEANYIDGLPLEPEIKYEIVAEGPDGGVNLNHYIYAICQRTLMINAQGISLM